MTKEQIEQQFDRILAELEGIQDHSAFNGYSEEDLERFMKPCVSARALLAAIDPHDTTFLPQLNWVMDKAQNGEIYPSRARPVISAAREHFAGGFHHIRELIEADVFEDLLGEAEHLHQHGFHVAAIAVAGAVLEDALRKLCAKHTVTWTGDSSINKLNTELYKASIYGKPQHCQVDAWGKLRNDADHGQLNAAGAVDPGDVKRMIEGVRDFILKYLT